ncbi:hypothetical protein F7725_016436 [Dissostichus mawsoni]|uniref:Uncharacterized protein n=1 Tax=Dissostichus mawsoni TaxID=36200 RepID=A0A7J5Z2I3_DISMA|nr:hypothetical protein F7725_016436 [Dissostichus mawsoni]
MTENTFPVYTADAIVTFYRAEVPLLVNIANPQYHEATLAITSVFLLMRQFLPICLVHDFALSDLLVPRGRQGPAAGFEKRHFRSTEEDRDAEAEADELEASLSELHTAAKHKFHEVNMRNERVAEKKTKNAEKTQKLTQVKVHVSNLKEDVDRGSPEELKSQMERMRENVKTIKCTIMFCLLQDLESSMTNSKQREQEHQDLTAQYEKKLKELKNLCSEEGQLKRTLVMKLDKESKLNIRRQKKKDIKEQHVQEVLGEYNHIHQKREEMANKIQEISSETQQLKAKIQSLRDVCSQETKKAQALYDTLSTSMDAMHRRIDMQTANLKQGLGKMSASLKK